MTPHRTHEDRLFLCLALVTALLACSRAPEARAPEGRTRKTLTVTGTVVEQVDGPPYSYLRLKTETGDVWVMVPTARVERSERVTIVEGFLLKDFETGLPGRRFDVIMGSLERQR